MKNSLLAVLVLTLLLTACSYNQRIVEQTKFPDERLNLLCKNDNLTGRIAFNEQYFMESLLNMYEATGDRRYIEVFVEHADHVLSVRDDFAGHRDFMGRLRPGWQAGKYYTLGIPLIIPDKKGRPSLEVQGIHRAGNNHTVVEVINKGEKEFSLVIRNDFRRKYPLLKSFDGMTIHTVEKRINKALSPEDWIYVKKVGPEPPACGIYSLKETYKIVLHELHTPLIGIPFLRFAALVFEDNKLRDYKDKAKKYVTAFKESYHDYEDSWHENEEGGYFVFESDGKYWASGLPVPYNGLSANGRFLLWLYRVTGKPEYLEKAAKLARRIRGGIKFLPDGTLTMPYWYSLPYKGWKDRNANPVNGIYVESKAYNGLEDISHFCLTLCFMVDAYKMGVVFDDKVMHAAANTFLKKIWKPRGKHENPDWKQGVYNTFLEKIWKIDGQLNCRNWREGLYLSHDLSGNGRAYDYTAGVFAKLSNWRPEIKEKALEVYCARFLDPGKISMDYNYGYVLLGWSILALQGEETKIAPVPLYPLTPRASAKKYVQINKRWHLDEDGILYIDYGKAYAGVGKRYNPGFIATYAQALCRDFLHTSDLSVKTDFLKQVNWLIAHHADRTYNGINFWVWEYDFDNPKFHAKASWVSAFTSGKIIPVFLKAYEFTCDLKYLRAAEHTLRAFLIPTHAGGITTFEENIAWYEEVADKDAPSSKILNGHISALEGLWTYWKWSSREDVKRLIDMGIAAVKKDLKHYDAGFLSYYSQYPKDPPVFAPAHGYNTLHVHQLLWLYSITGDPVFLDFALLFERYDDPGCEITVAGSTDPEGHGPEKLNLEMGTKYWSHNQFPTWVQIDLGSTQEATGVTLMGYIPKASPKDYNVLCSVDGKRWKLLLEKRGNTKQYSTERFESEQVRYLRIVIMSDNGNNNVALTGIGIQTTDGNPAAVSDWKSFSSGNRPTRIFDSGWIIPKRKGWLVADLVKPTIGRIVVEVTGQTNPEITFAGSDDLMDFTPLQFHKDGPARYAIDAMPYRYLRIEIQEGAKGGILRFIKSE